METDYKGISCECGNEITWTDSYEFGFKYLDDEIMICNKCKKEHGFISLDTISDIKGGTLKKWTPPE